MHLLLLTLFIIACFTYLFVCIKSKAQPITRNGTANNTKPESISIPQKLAIFSIVVLIGYLLLYHSDEKRIKEKEARENFRSQQINEKNLIDAWRTDEVILNIKPDKNFTYKVFAGINKNKSWTGKWELNTGILFLYFNGDTNNSWNYRVVSIDKTQLKVERKEKNSDGILQVMATGFERIQ